MRPSPRTVFGVITLGLGGWALFSIFRPAPSSATSVAFTSSQQCQACHPAVFEEWSASWHAQAWTDPEVRALSNDFRNTDCIDCHAPRPVFETGIGKRVLPRNSRQAEGVDCIACHLLPASGGAATPPAHGGGLVAGTRDDPAAACRPVAMRELGSPDYCGVCHDQHQTVQQWKASKYYAQGIGCVECHMPPKARENRQGRDHTMHGGHDIALVRSAVELRGRREGERWIVEVENVGAGHHYPTDERSRASDVFWRPVAEAEAGPRAWRHLYRFRSPYRHEVDLVDTLLAASATQTLSIDDPAALREPIEVALFYARKPYWSDPALPDPEREAELVHRIVLTP